jgi:putative sterol carrier protein
VQKSRERKSLWADTFIQLADGKLNGQKAFMTGALKVKGNVMLAVSKAFHLPF